MKFNYQMLKRLILFIIHISIIYSLINNENFFFHLSDFHFDPISQPTIYNSSTLCRPLNSCYFPLYNNLFIQNCQLTIKYQNFPHSKMDRIINIYDNNNNNNGFFGRYGCDSTLFLIESR